MTRAQVIIEARTCVGTPYRHQGRIKRIALDCVGLVTVLGRFAGVVFEDCQTYDRMGRGSDLNEHLSKWMLPVDLKGVRPGDVITFTTFDPARATHVGLLTDYGLLHTHARIKKVVEHGYPLAGDTRWPNGYESKAFAFPGLED